MKRSENISISLDWPAVGLYVALVLMGLINIYAVVFDEGAAQSVFNTDFSPGRQLLFILASFVIIMAIVIIDMRFYETFAYVFYGIIMFMVFLIPLIGKEVGGNKAWLGVGSFGIQPSEFAKFATALVIAKYVGSVSFRMDNLRHQATAFAIIVFPMALILLQKDTGTALVFTSFILVFFREGMSPFLMIIGICAAVIFILTLLIPNHLYLFAAVGITVALLIFFGKKTFKRISLFIVGGLIIMASIQSVDYVINNVLKPHQRDRVRALINPDADPLGAGWNVTQSKIAIGSGGFLGKGFLKGTQTKYDFVPEQKTDFIFCTIGEEHGWLGSLVVVALFVALLLRVIFIAERQKNKFTRIYAYSVASIFFFHFAVNIGMTIGLFPVIGIPLPFFSYGGSSLWGFTILLFILLKLDAHRMQVLQRV